MAGAHENERKRGERDRGGGRAAYDGAVLRIGDVDQCALYVSLAPGMENPAGMDLSEGDAARAASDVYPDNVAGQKTAEPAVVVEDAAPQTTQEGTEGHPTVVVGAETAEEHPAPAKTRAGTTVGNEETARTPPPNSVAEEEDKAPTLPPAEERRVPTPPRAETSSPKGSPGHGKGPVIPVTTAGGSTGGEETQAASDDEVEEIQGRPHDGRQHVARLRQEKERLDQERAGALEAGRRAGVELSNKSRELAVQYDTPVVEFVAAHSTLNTHVREILVLDVRNVPEIDVSPAGVSHYLHLW
ncbi:uncharacterized protein LOC110430404 [Sorghum bicolor]|uniref:uncharacterized protein LOC110430404 n=1 Tax=Sorghum bicolor TaxID=4558 RepID=UPI000B42648C|nr:uncharacterized protein LOC110430404 [Sorghum bicolor]|eukprot:XP_021303745.1 uncharacterized protein LOC110430404 [Sorghum bicolor]